MSASFQDLTVMETAWRRRVRLAVSVTDAVTGEVIRDGLTVSVAGFQRKPIINASGHYVWLAEANAAPGAISIDPGDLPYLPQQVAAPVPPPPPSHASFVSVALSPTPAYPFDTGVSGIRSTLVRDSAEDPLVPIALQPPAERAWLQWMDENQALPGWTDSPFPSTTDAHGDLAAIVRFGPGQSPRVDGQGRLRLRLAVTHAGVTRYSPETPARPGFVSDDTRHLFWNQFTNT